MSHYYSEEVLTPLKLRRVSGMILGKMYQFDIAPGVFSSQKVDKGSLALCELMPVSYTHLRAHETPEHLVCRLLLEKKK